MDSLKAVGQAIKNSPKAIRKKIAGESARHDSKCRDAVAQLAVTRKLPASMSACVYASVRIVSSANCLCIRRECSLHGVGIFSL